MKVLGYFLITLPFLFAASVAYVLMGFWLTAATFGTAGIMMGCMFLGVYLTDDN